MVPVVRFKRVAMDHLDIGTTKMLSFFFYYYMAVTAVLNFYLPIITHITLLLPCYFSVTADLTFFYQLSHTLPCCSPVISQLLQI
jgi:hypothetical protein